MKKANSTDPAKFAPEIFNVSFKGATGEVQFDQKGDRKNAEMTIFKMEGGKVKPVAIVKNGQSTPFNANAAATGSGGPTPSASATAPASAPAAPAKDEKKDSAKTDTKKQ